MTVKTLSEKLDLAPIVVSDESRRIEGGYAGDLLSWVMSRARPDQAWITIMSNINVVAVATLADVACVILSEDVRLDDGVAEQAKKRGVNIYGSGLPTFELCAQVSALL